MHLYICPSYFWQINTFPVAREKPFETCNFTRKKICSNFIMCNFLLPCSVIPTLVVVASIVARCEAKLTLINLKIILLWHQKNSASRMWHVSCAIRQDNLTPLYYKRLNVDHSMEYLTNGRVRSLSQVYQRLAAVNALDKLSGANKRVVAT